MTQGRLSESVYIYQYFFKNSNSTHQVKLRVTLKTDTWGKHLANKDSSTYSNVAQKHIMQQKLSVESPAIRARACLSSAGALLSKPGRHLLLGQNQVPGGRADTSNSVKDKIQFLHEMDKETSSPMPPRDSGLCRDSTCPPGNKACLQPTFQFGLPH